MQPSEPYATRRALLQENSTASAAKRALFKTAYATKTALLKETSNANKRAILQGLGFRV
jgi:hypothetical protein